MQYFANVFWFSVTVSLQAIPSKWFCLEKGSVYSLEAYKMKICIKKKKGFKAKIHIQFKNKFAFYFTLAWKQTCHFLTTKQYPFLIMTSLSLPYPLKNLPQSSIHSWSWHLSVCRILWRTYHKAVSILDHDIPQFAVSFEELTTKQYPFLIMTSLSLPYPLKNFSTSLSRQWCETCPI